jgi:hypothetical protein
MAESGRNFCKQHTHLMAESGVRRIISGIRRIILVASLRRQQLMAKSGIRRIILTASLRRIIIAEFINRIRLWIK